jgi:hypothetical protein
MTIRRILTSGAAVASLMALAACGGDSSLDTAGKGQVAILMSTTGGSSAFPTADINLDSGSLAALASNASASGSSQGSCQAGNVLQAATVTLSSIMARTIDGKLTNVTIDLSVPVDLLALLNGKTATLPVGSLPPGTYDQIVVVMKTVEVTLQSGMKIAVTPPGGGWTAIVAVAQPFTVKEGTTTTIALNFRMDLSFACAIASWDLKPKLHCDRADND